VDAVDDLEGSVGGGRVVEKVYRGAGEREEGGALVA